MSSYILSNEWKTRSSNICIVQFNLVAYLFVFITVLWVFLSGYLEEFVWGQKKKENVRYNWRWVWRKQGLCWYFRVCMFTYFTPSHLRTSPYSRAGGQGSSVGKNPKLAIYRSQVRALLLAGLFLVWAFSKPLTSSCSRGFGSPWYKNGGPNQWIKVRNHSTVVDKSRWISTGDV